MNARELLVLALDALEDANGLAADLNSEGCFDEQIEAIRTHLEKPEPTPVAWMTEAAWGTSVALEKPDFGEAAWKAPTPRVIPLYRKDQL
jgi:hypothetical protein